MRRMLISLVVLSLAAAGCTGADKDVEPPPADSAGETGGGRTGYGPAQSASGTECSETEATPISVSDALQALRGHGLAMRRDRSGVCIEGVAAVLDNAPEDFDSQGSVSCFLSARQDPQAPTTVVRRGVDGGDAELLLANLTCAILADSPRAEDKIDPLEAAFDELQRTIRP